MQNWEGKFVFARSRNIIWSWERLQSVLPFWENLIIIYVLSCRVKVFKDIVFWSIPLHKISSLGQNWMLLGPEGGVCENIWAWISPLNFKILIFSILSPITIPLIYHFHTKQPKQTNKKHPTWTKLKLKKHIIIVNWVLL